MNYPSIRIEGAILSPDIFDRLDDAVGQQPADFGLESSAKVKDEIARAWADAQDYWRIFKRKLESLKTDSPATTETRNNWMVPLLGLLGYQLEYQARGTELNGKNYPLSHRVTNKAQTPVHIIGYHEPSGLDRKPEKSALRMSAHAMVQEYLNLTDQLYALATNGRVLRLLRDSSRLVKLSYLEFDLDRIFSDGLFADFAMLYRLLHASRLPQTAEAASSCWLERYHQDTIEQGTRIREGLRVAVTEALELLGTGFISHPDNQALREQITAGQLAPEDFFKHILRLVYRQLFLMVIEERGLVFPKGTPTKAINIYFQHYSMQRLRRLAVTRGLKIERFFDAWLSLQATFRLFEQQDTANKLGMSALGGMLFHPEALGPLTGCRLSNASLFAALDRLCNFNHPQTGQRMPVNFGALATEEFGSVYESLLELHPIVEAGPSPRFGFKQAAGNERKTSGSYYTPTSLVDCLLDSALDPVLDERIRDFAKLGFPSAEAAILAMKVCDPACGSGHFLIAAAQRIARRLARVRSGDDEPSPQVMRHALRDVISHCIYGVDINPMSVELCKVALWMEAMEPGKPLSFLDHHIQCGNSLLGTTPALLAKGIPDDAFTAIEGDVKTRVASLKKQNKSERPTESGKRQRLLGEVPFKLGNIAADFARLNMAPDGTLAEVSALQEQYARLIRSSEYESTRLLADTWCAAFVWKKDDSDLGKMCPTERDFRKVESHAAAGLLPHVRAEVERLRDQYQFFHWHLAFPDVFRLPGKAETPENEQTGWSGGFDVMLGNPPWERIKIQDKEWFAQRIPAIADAKNAGTRRTLISKLRVDAPQVFQEFEDACRAAESQSHVLRNSMRYPLCGRGDINTYMIFSELNQSITSVNGRVGFIVPSGIATDDTTKLFFQFLIQAGLLVSLFDFRNKGFFDDVAGAQGNRFALMTLTGKRKPSRIVRLMFRGEAITDLDNADRVFELNANDFAAINPNTLTCPVFQTVGDARIVKRVYSRLSVLYRDDNTTTNEWQVRIRRVLDMNKQDVLAQCADEPDAADSWVPVCESKMIHQFDSQFGSYEGVVLSGKGVRQIPTPDLSARLNPSFQPKPRYWIRSADFRERLIDGSAQDWFVVWRDITSNVDFRTVIAAIIPFMGADFTLRLATMEPRSHAPAILALFNSFVFDFISRQKLGGTHLSDYITFQLPVPPPAHFGQRAQWQASGPFLDWIVVRVLELTYTNWNLEPFARDCGYAGPPFRWDEERRFRLRAELDAAFFHFYLPADPHGDWLPAPASSGHAESPEDLARLKASFPTPRHAVDYILDTFPIVRRKDEEKHGDYRTKRVILEIYDSMSEAIRTGKPYQTILDPPPADPRVAHPDTRKATAQLPAAFVDPTFPSTAAEKVFCAATLDLVRANPNRSDFEFVELLSLLLTSETVLMLLADKDDERAWQNLIQYAPPELRSPPQQPHWFQIRDALASIDAIAISEGRLTTGPKWSEVRSRLPAINTNLIALVTKAAQVVLDRKDLSAEQQREVETIRKKLKSVVVMNN